MWYSKSAEQVRFRRLRTPVARMPLKAALNCSLRYSLGRATPRRSTT